MYALAFGTFLVLSSYAPTDEASLNSPFDSPTMMIDTCLGMPFLRRVAEFMHAVVLWLAFSTAQYLATQHSQ